MIDNTFCQTTDSHTETINVLQLKVTHQGKDCFVSVEEPGNNFCKKQLLTFAQLRTSRP